MKTRINTATVCLGAVLLCSAFAASANACGLPTNFKILSSRQPGKPAAANQAASADRTPLEFNPLAAPIVGLWYMTLTAGGQVVDSGIDAWHSDGLETLNDIPAPATGNVCLGVWVRTGHRSFKLKHPGWRWDSNGTLIGTFLLIEQVTVNSEGNKYSGSFTFDIFDLNGTQTFHGEGEVSGERITVN